MIRGTSALLAAFALWSWLEPAAANVRTVALRGDPAFSAGGDAAFGSFSLPSLNNRGQVAFGAQLIGADVSTSTDSGVWIATNGEVANVIREGDQAPGMAVGGKFGNLVPSNLQIPLNDAGDVAFGQSVSFIPTFLSSGLWIGNEHSLSLLAKQGDVAAGAQNGAAFWSFDQVRASVNARGDVAVYGRLDGAYATINGINDYDGLWVMNRDGAVGQILVAGAVPELGPEAQFASIPQYYRPSLNRNGEAAQTIGYRLTPSSFFSNSVWVVSSAGRELRAVNGQLLPEIDSDATLSVNGQAVINASGAVAANGTVTNPGSTPANRSAIALLDGSGVEIAVMAGNEAPGTGGDTFGSTIYDQVLSSGGHVAFYGSAGDGVSSYTGVWAGKPGDLRLVAQQGAVAPGTDEAFGGFTRNTPGINRFGQVAFSAGLADAQTGGVTPSIWATSLEGDASLIARVGETLEVAPGDSRTISGLSQLTNYGDNDGRARGLNDLGQVVFGASFTDGSSGIFLSNAVAHLPGDYNSDGTVDGADYIVWRKTVGTSSSNADGDRNGVVNEEDLALVGEFFGMSLALEQEGGAAPTPEPRLAAIGAILGLLLLWNRRTTVSL